MEVKLTINAPALINDIKALGPADFIISNHDDHYACHFVILAASSDRVAGLRDSQMRHPPELIIQSRHPFRHLKSFLDYFCGDPIEATADNIFELEVLAPLFDVKSLMSQVVPVSQFYRHLESVLDNEIGSDEIAFLASFFEVASRHRKFLNLSPDLQEAVLAHPALRIRSEDSLLHWILSVRGSLNFPLVSIFLLQVKFENVSADGFRELFAVPFPLVPEIRTRLLAEFVLDERTPVPFPSRYFSSDDALFAADVSASQEPQKALGGSAPVINDMSSDGDSLQERPSDDTGSDCMEVLPPQCSMPSLGSQSRPIVVDSSTSDIDT
jgi:hypothetical protein